MCIIYKLLNTAWFKRSGQTNTNYKTLTAKSHPPTPRHTPHTHTLPPHPIRSSQPLAIALSPLALICHHGLTTASLTPATPSPSPPCSPLTTPVAPPPPHAALLKHKHKQQSARRSSDDSSAEKHRSRVKPPNIELELLAAGDDRYEV